jgi:hypothetical protein
MAESRLVSDLTAMVGVWRDELTATDAEGVPVLWDHHGGIPGAFPYTNLVYVDFDGVKYQQTNVTIAGRDLHERSFTATVRDGVLIFDRLGPEAPEHRGVSGGPGLVWFVATNLGDSGLQRYAEPDLIRIDGDRRWRDTVLWRNGALARLLHVEGTRVSVSTTELHPLDPRPGGTAVHGQRSVTTNYQSQPQTDTASGSEFQEVQL